MALSASDRAILGTWCGDGAVTADLDGFDERTDRLGSVYAASLEWLLARQATLITRASNIAAGSDRFNHEKNVAWVAGQIDRLVGFVQGSDDVAFSGASLLLLDQAQGAPPGGSVVVNMAAPNVRRG